MLPYVQQQAQLLRRRKERGAGLWVRRILSTLAGRSTSTSAVHMLQHDSSKVVQLSSPPALEPPQVPLTASRQSSGKQGSAATGKLLGWAAAAAL